MTAPRPDPDRGAATTGTTGVTGGTGDTVQPVQTEHTEHDPADERRRWLTTVLVAVLVAVGCVAAGVWQWSRHADRSAAVAVVEANYEAPVVGLEELVRPGDALPADAVWRRAAVTGRYVGDPVLLRNRPVSGQPALHVLQPLVVEAGPLSGSVLVVDRGWLPTGEAGEGAVPAAPPGQVEVVARLRQEEEPSGRDAPAGQVQEVVVEDVRAASGPPPQWPEGAALRLYGAVVTEDGAPAEGLGRLPAPRTALGTNLSYAFQWWLFAVGALAAPLVLRRKERRDAAEAAAAAAERAGTPDGATAPSTDEPSPRPAVARRRRRPTAEEEEDALLDAHLRDIPGRDGP
ncbi:SURF1 family protein [Actinotalea sp. Marseille-Q4924]|uniref:SURF1 family protein n=1 Tax=Actinotalea sp. Marseille-Q4924 TaxID=2866571 RepID=UPI001CE45A53|nr:SURF1 family protein [Actinotalea sp. Marseille-Q4924]